MNNYARSLPLLVLLALSLLLSGCDPKCWPICSSSSSGVTDSSTSTTDSTIEITPSGRLCNDTNATITEITLSGPQGGESFEVIDTTGGKRNPIPIRWSKTGVGSVCVDLYKSDVFYYRIAGDSDSYKQTETGMDWRPHASLEASSEYQIKLISPNDSTVTDMSLYYFSITEPK